MWPFSKGPSEDDESEQETEYVMDKIPLTTLFRWYMYDMNVEEPNQHVNVFDLTPVSEEGDEKERQESDNRSDQVEPLLPFLNLYANMNAKYIFEMQKADLLDAPGMTESKLRDEAAVIQAFYRQVTFAGLVTSFSSALELGLVKVNGSYTEID
ncbi:hypothetical protein UFOVP225_113 [uncultured Caudovirales phage]|uniref:Uncharacterized protein n=1 Tax=uncultured Caudovirales phage TaxID=2100421 RepID=A0A6J7WS99_9CAUD|nr:hypothetical protein UFOVP113_126 [uncultured Caudovirales phage]CAB5219698.1 hypothetical protein UFOVP225_113 [uncultured Caudovirales phage]